MKRYFALGTYTEDILFGTGEVFHGKGKGISICEFDDGNIRESSRIQVRNPSFLCLNEAKRKLYAVNEMKEYQGYLAEASPSCPMMKRAAWRSRRNFPQRAQTHAMWQ
ncbi:MAG: beta-propeller fold lactonase family protein [Enterocloster clostridioformis]